MDGSNKYYELFTKDCNSIQYTSTSGKMCTFKTASLKIPQMVSRIWTTKLIGELPEVSIDEKTLQDIFEQDILKGIDKPINMLMAIGKVFIVPFLNNKNEYKFDVINEHENKVKYVMKDDELIYLEYQKRESILDKDKVSDKTVNYIHKVQDGVYYSERYYESGNIKIFIDGIDGTKKLANDMMFPFMVDLTVNFDKEGFPIWSNAYYQCEDADNTYTEMLDVMKRLSPVVGIPKDLVNDRDDSVGLIDLSSRIFQLIPGLSDDLPWQYFGGGFDPEPFIKTIDYILNNISQQCGLGHRALSYDQTLGVVKTATEVSFSQNDLMINKSLVNQTIEYLLKRLSKSFYYMKESIWIEDTDINVVFEDAVFNTTQEYKDQLKYDVQMGNINKEFYLSEIYKNKPYDEIAGSDEEII